MLQKLVIFSLVIILSPSSWRNGVSCDMFTAQVDLEALFPTQELVVEAVEIFLAKEELRIKEIRRRLQSFVERGKKKPQDVISNPISAYLLLKGLTLDLDDLQNIAEQNHNVQVLKNTLKDLHTSNRFPITEDLNGAAVALARLQDTYQLETVDIARGDLHGHCCADSLNSEDLFELGRQSYTQGDMDHTILWMHEALNRFHEERQNSTSFHGEYRAASESDILEYLAFSTYQKGELQHAIHLTEDLLRVHPNHPRASGNIAHYQRMIDEKKGEDGGVSDKGLMPLVISGSLCFMTLIENALQVKGDLLSHEGILLSRLMHSFTIREKRESQIGWEKVKYEALCRGEQQLVQHRAKCRYTSKGNPYLLIGPVKEEVVYEKPKIWIYHDIISDSEIEIVKTLARPKFKRATVHDHATGELVTAQYRISKSSWLRGEEHPSIEKVNKRIQAITGLDVETAEELQVVNYGLGGHYEPHFDFARRDEKDAFKSLGTGNRIATYLLYLSDVEAGGATVFPSLNLSLWPHKGAAAFWYNLLEDGTGDVSTRHAACPILFGTKWVANKWIHERGQEFRRPCGPKPSEVNERD